MTRAARWHADTLSAAEYTWGGKEDLNILSHSFSLNLAISSKAELPCNLLQAEGIALVT